MLALFACRCASKKLLSCALVAGLWLLDGGWLSAQSDISRTGKPAEQSTSAVRTAAGLRQVLRDGAIDERRLAAKQTRDLSREDQIDLLPDMIDLLRHENDGQIRLSLFDTLMEMGPAAERAVPALVNAIRQRFGGRYNEELHQDYRAALVLSQVGQAAVEGLRNLLLEESESMRAEAAMALGRIGPAAAAAIPDLILLLNDESSRVRVDVVKALGSVGTPATAALLQASQSEEIQVRSGAITALSLVAPGHPDVIELILAAVDDEAAEMRMAACEALDVLDLKPAKLAELLLVRIQDQEPGVRNVALNLLARRPQLVRSRQLQLLELLTHESDEVAWYAAFLLQGLGPESLPLLLEAVEKPNSRLDQLARAISLIDKLSVSKLYDALDAEGPRARQLAALALGQIRPIRSETVQRLAVGLEGADEPLRMALLKSLASLGKQASAAVPSVRSLAEQDSEEARRQIVEVLSVAAPRDSQLLEDLTRFSQDAGSTVQLSAIASLQALGPAARSAIPVVMQTLSSRDSGVRKAALEFLGSHGPAAASAVSLLQQELVSTVDGEWQVAIIDTLGRIGRGAQSAYPELAARMRDDSSEIRQACIRTLSRLDLELNDLKPHLLQALSDADEAVSSEASSSIRRLGAKGTMLVPDLIALLNEPKLEEGVQRLLDRFERYETDPNSIGALSELLERDNPQIQRAAMRFLGLAGSAAKSATGRLRSLADSENEVLRTQALETLQAIEKADDASAAASERDI